MAFPFFSIIIPCYNQAAYLSDCLDSVLTQSFADWEAIIINDGSTDNTHDIASSYVFKDGRIRLIEKKNGGLSSARNAGMLAAEGARFLFLDADDFLNQGCLGAIADASKQCDEKALIQFGYSYITEDKSHVLHTALPAKRDSFFPYILSGPPGPCHSICISKSLASTIGEFDEGLKGLEDWDYWLRAAKAGATQYSISIPLVFYRYVRFSMSRNPFAMFASLKIVAKRASLKDDRITSESNLNYDRSFDYDSVIQRGLIRLMGVAVMQNKQKEALDFYNKESYKPLTDYTPQELEDMCSYLSFRYWYRKKDVEEVLMNIKPLFVSFFLLAGLKKKIAQKAVFLIFKRHLFYKNIYRYGKFPGAVMNFFLRIKFQ